jgi:hypothetical protein
MLPRFGAPGTVRLLMAVLLVAACGTSNSETPVPGQRDAGGITTGGTGGITTGGTGGITTGGTGGITTGGSGGMTTGGTGGGSTDGGATGGSGGSTAPDAGPPSMTGACTAEAGALLGVHIVMDVTWPASTASSAGTGKIHLWNRSTVTATGNTLDGTTQGCGTLLPDTVLNGLGSLAAGGNKLLIEVPDAVWEAPSMPKYPTRGTQSGAAVGSTVSLGWTALIGLTLTDPQGAWPDSSRGLMGIDADGDGAPGYTAAPRSGGGYVLPPTAIGLGGSAPAAERVYLVSRHVIEVSGMRPACDQQLGKATVRAFDSHVIGCKLRGGQECSPAQTDFLDGNRPKYVVAGATYEARAMPAAATCADIRKAFPAR